MTEKWTNAEILHFLNIYEKYDILWNTQLPGYRDKHNREIALKHMLEEFSMKGLTVDIIRNKIKMIKTVYNQEKKKIIKSSQNASSTDEIYRPKLAWFSKADSFLRNILTNSRNSNLKIENEEVEVEHEQEEISTLYLSSEEDKTKQNPRKVLQRKPARYTNHSPVRKQNEIIKNKINKLKKLVEASKNDDEFDYFGKYIASQLRQLPIINALQCQEQMLNLVTQERLATIQQAELEANNSQTQWNGTSEYD